jgi:hypothetical protein
MMMLVVPGAVLNMCRKSLNTCARNVPPPPTVSGRPHFSWKKSVDNAVNGKIAE